MIDSFNDFVGGWTPDSSNVKKPYIYVMEYILSKENSMNELKEYILSYTDEESDYEDNKSYDPFMKKLKILASQDEFNEIEEMILSYESYSDERLDFDSDDDDFEEKMYDPDYDDDDNIEENKYPEYDDDDDDDLENDEDFIETEQISNYGLSDQLKEFLKVDIEFEDLGKEYETINDIEFEELDNVILDPKYNADEIEKEVKEMLEKEDEKED